MGANGLLRPPTVPCGDVQGCGEQKDVHPLRHVHVGSVPVSERLQLSIANHVGHPSWRYVKDARCL
jgi:hypothetical protein